MIYAAPRTDIKELTQTRQLLVEKFGRDFTVASMENNGDVIPQRILRKLKVEPPGRELVESYLKEIARTYGVKYGDDAGEDEEMGNSNGEGQQPGSGGQAVRILEEIQPTADELSKMTPPRDLGSRRPVSVAPPSPTTDNANPRLKLPGPPEGQPPRMNRLDVKMVPKSTGPLNVVDTVVKVDGDIPNVNDLEKRFALLKR